MAALQLPPRVPHVHIDRKPVQLAIVFAGKRKSGKDYCSDRLLALIGDEVAEIGRLSGPLKKAYAEEHDLDYAELLTASSYKEQHRARMITWGEERRNADAGFFARKVLTAASKPILIISDARRPGDVAFFQDNVPTVITVRVEASQETRKQRGWAFASGVDDAESECGLDAYEPWDIVLKNEDEADLHEHLAMLTKKAADALATQADSLRAKMHKPT